MKHVLIYKKYIKIRENTKNTKKLRMMVAVSEKACFCPKKHVFEKKYAPNYLDFPVSTEWCVFMF